MITLFRAQGVLTGSDAEHALDQGPGGHMLWVDLEAPEPDEVRRIGERLGLHPDAIDDCLVGEQLPRLDEYGDHVFCICYGVADDADGQPRPAKLALACGKNFVLSVHRTPLIGVQRLRQRWQQEPAVVVRLGPEGIFYRLFDATVDRLVEAAERFEDVVEQLEDQSLARDVDPSLLGRVVELRPGVLQLRRIAVQEREVVAPLCRGECEYIDAGLERSFSHVRDHLTRVVELTDAIRERLVVVRENYRAAQADRLNEVMKTLTVFATVLLPLSVITGIYGMNVPLWPNPQHPATFWAIIATMAGVVVGLLVYFRHKKWI